MKLEGIFKGKRKIGSEILFESMDIPLNGKKERFFESIDEDIDFEIFMRNYEKAKDLKGLKFFNLKPQTLAKYGKEILSVIDPKTVLEIRESNADEKVIKSIVKIRKEKPFLLSLDDFGKNSSNFDRIEAFKPDFIKVEIPLFSKKNLVLFVSLLKVTCTAKLIAEKVENVEDFKTAKLAGFDLWQGYCEKELYSF